MNRIQLVQVIVIIMAMVLGYEMTYAFSFFVGYTISYFLGGSEAFAYPLVYGFTALLFAISLFVVLNNAAKLSMWVINKVQPDEAIQLSFTDKNVLFGIFLFLTLSSLFRNIPVIIYQVFELFRREAAMSTEPYVSYESRMNYPKIIEAILAFILLTNIKSVVNYFYKKIDAYDPHYVSDKAENDPTIE